MSPSLWSRVLTRRQVLKALVASGVGLTAGTASYGYFIERYQVGVTDVPLPVDGLPQPLEGLRVGILTDPHVSGTVPPVVVARAVELLRAQAPDVIVLGGDYISWGDVSYVERAAEQLRTLTAPFGVFAVFGNHDDEGRLEAALSRAGIACLRDARRSVEIRGQLVDLVGIRFWTRRRDAIETLLQGARGFPILLAHDPRRLREAVAAGCPLVISGHTHGGQIVMPGLGAIAAQRFPIAQGVLRESRTTLFVSRGVGTVVLPWRYNCPPEVAVLTLHRA